VNTTFGKQAEYKSSLIFVTQESLSRLGYAVCVAAADSVLKNA